MTAESYEKFRTWLLAKGAVETANHPNQVPVSVWEFPWDVTDPDDPDMGEPVILEIPLEKFLKDYDRRLMEVFDNLARTLRRSKREIIWEIFGISILAEGPFVQDYTLERMPDDELESLIRKAVGEKSARERTRIQKNRMDLHRRATQGASLDDEGQLRLIKELLQAFGLNSPNPALAVANLLRSLEKPQ